MKFTITMNEDKDTMKEKPYCITYPISDKKSMQRSCNGYVTLGEIIDTYKQDRFKKECKSS